MIKRLIIVFFCLLIPSVAYAGPTTASGVTAGTIIERARADLNAINESGVTDVFYPDSDLIQWANEAVVQIVNKTRCLESGASNISVKNLTRRYSINKTFLDVEMVEYDTGNTTDPKKPMIYTLDRVEKKDIGHNWETGNPKVYSVWNDNLEIWPMPASAQSGNTLYLYTIDLPSGVTSTESVIETPASLDAAILCYVKSKGLYKSGNNNQGNQFLAIFDLMVKEYAINVLRRKPLE